MTKLRLGGEGGIENQGEPTRGNHKRRASESKEVHSLWPERKGMS